MNLDLSSSKQPLLTLAVRLVRLQEGDKVARVAPIAVEPPIEPELPIQ